MSKPKPIEYVLNSWSIIYNEVYFDASAKTGELHYQANIRYLAKLPPDRSFENRPRSDDHNDKKYFQTFEEAKKWIDKELR